MTFKEVQHAYDQARNLFSQNKFAEADAHCAQIHKLEPDHAGAVFLRGIIALGQHNPAHAITYLNHAAKLNPKKPDYFAQLAKTCVLLNQYDNARTAAETALSLKPKDALTLDTIGVVLSHLGEHHSAAAAFLDASKLKPRNTSFLYNLATSLKYAGDFSGAEKALQTTLDLDPNTHKAWYALAYLRKQTPEHNHIPELQQALETFSGKIEGKMQLGYALSKELEDIGQPAEAWSVLTRTNTSWNSHSRYSPEQDRDIVEQLIRSFTKEFLSTKPGGCESDEPVFITGMPRSGTTLTDRILSSHSQVHSSGELPYINQLTKQMSGSISNAMLDRRTVKKSTSINFSELGHRYIESTRPSTGHTKHFIDKLPVNFLYLGIIMLAFPNAKIINLRRNPMDVCLGNFRQLFALGYPFYSYSYNILNCGRYYLLFDKLMRHWQTVFPGRILEINYEDIVEHQEQKTRELLNYCDLEWEDQCLTFEKNAAPVATASSAQVREPLNRKGLGRWKNYEQELQPLVEFFHDHNIEVDT